MANDEYISNTRGARRYRFDEEVRRKRNAAAIGKAETTPFLLMWLLAAVGIAAAIYGVL